MVDVAHDGLQPFEKRDDISSNVIWIRLRSVPWSWFNKQANLRVVLVASKVQQIQPLYRHILQELNRLRPGGDKVCFTGRNGSHRCVHIMVAGLFGDMVARQELTAAPGPAAYLGCDYCVFNACRLPDKISRSSSNKYGPISNQYPAVPPRGFSTKLVYAGYHKSVVQDRLLGAPLFQPPDRTP